MEQPVQVHPQLGEDGLVEPVVRLEIGAHDRVEFSVEIEGSTRRQPHEQETHDHDGQE